METLKHQIFSSNIDFFKNKRSFFDYSSHYSTMRSYSWNNNFFQYQIYSFTLNYLDGLERFNKIKFDILKKEKKYFLDNDTQNNFKLLKEHLENIEDIKKSIKNELKEVSKILNIGYEKYTYNNSFKNDVFKHLDTIDSLIQKYELSVYDNSLSSLTLDSLKNCKEKSFFEYLLNKNQSLTIEPITENKKIKLR